MTRPDTLFEAASYDLNKFIERRIADRRAMQRDSADRRKQNRPMPQPEGSSTIETSDNSIQKPH